jgi:hypothetical protein
VIADERLIVVVAGSVTPAETRYVVVVVVPAVDPVKAGISDAGYRPRDKFSVHLCSFVVSSDLLGRTSHCVA